MGRLSKQILQAIESCCMTGKVTLDQLSAVFQHIDAINVDNQRLIDNVAQLQKEHNEMKLGLDQATSDANEWENAYFNLRDDSTPKKVILPKEVADALKNLRVELAYQNDDNHLLWSLLQAPREEDEGDIDHFIRTLVNENKLEVFVLAKAIMFGYTVEEVSTTEVRIKNKLYEELMLQKILYPIDVSKLAQNLTLAIREILAEDAVKHHES